jgi:hypothetical protein
MPTLISFQSLILLLSNRISTNVSLLLWNDHDSALKIAKVSLLSPSLYNRCLFGVGLLYNGYAYLAGRLHLHHQLHIIDSLLVFRLSIIKGD